MKKILIAIMSLALLDELIGLNNIKIMIALWGYDYIDKKKYKDYIDKYKHKL